MNRPLTEKPLYIKVHDADNVAIVVNNQGLPAGTRFEDGLQLTEHVPQGHKVALVDIPENGVILRYGEVIGTALRPIAQGSWIEESLVALPEAPPLNSLPLANNVPPLCHRSKVTPLRVIATPMAASERAICSVLPPACTVWLA